MDGWEIEESDGGKGAWSDSHGGREDYSTTGLLAERAAEACNDAGIQELCRAMYQISAAASAIQVAWRAYKERTTSRSGRRPSVTVPEAALQRQLWAWDASRPGASAVAAWRPVGATQGGVFGAFERLDWSERKGALWRAALYLQTRRWWVPGKFEQHRLQELLKKEAGWRGALGKLPGCFGAFLPMQWGAVEAEDGEGRRRVLGTTTSLTHHLPPQHAAPFSCDSADNRVRGRDGVAGAPRLPSTCTLNQPQTAPSKVGREYTTAQDAQNGRPSRTTSEQRQQLQQHQQQNQCHDGQQHHPHHQERHQHNQRQHHQQHHKEYRHQHNKRIQQQHQHERYHQQHDQHRRDQRRRGDALAPAAMSSSPRRAKPAQTRHAAEHSDAHRAPSSQQQRTPHDRLGPSGVSPYRDTMPSIISAQQRDDAAEDKLIGKEGCIVTPSAAAVVRGEAAQSNLSSSPHQQRSLFSSPHQQSSEVEGYGGGRDGCQPGAIHQLATPTTAKPTPNNNKHGSPSNNATQADPPHQRPHPHSHATYVTSATTPNSAVVNATSPVSGHGRCYTTSALGASGAGGSVSSSIGGTRAARAVYAKSVGDGNSSATYALPALRLPSQSGRAEVRRGGERLSRPGDGSSLARTVRCSTERRSGGQEFWGRRWGGQGGDVVVAPSLLHLLRPPGSDEAVVVNRRGRARIAQLQGMLRAAEEEEGAHRVRFTARRNELVKRRGRGGEASQHPAHLSLPSIHNEGRR